MSSESAPASTQNDFDFEEAKRRALELAESVGLRAKRTFEEGPGSSPAATTESKLDTLPEIGADERTERVYFPGQPGVDWVDTIRAARAHIENVVTNCGAKIYVQAEGEQIYAVIVSKSAEHEAQAKTALEDLIFNPSVRETMTKRVQQSEAGRGAPQGIPTINGGAAAVAAPAAAAPAGNAPYIIAAGAPMPVPGAVSGEVIVEIKIPNDKVALVIGKGGDNIRAINNQTRCQIRISPETTPPEPFRLVTLTGTPAAIEQAKVMIQDSITRYEARAAFQAQGPALGTTEIVTSSGEKLYQETFQVPSASIRHIIGPKGETIKQLQLRCRCTIQVQRDSETEPGAKYRNVTIIGTPEQVTQCRNEIMYIAQQAESGAFQSSGRSSGSGGPAPGGPLSVTIYVPNEVVGLLIGKAGQTIRKIQDQSRASIQVARDDRTPMRPVTISSERAEDIEYAKRLIHEATTGGREGQRQQQQGGQQAYGAYGAPVAGAYGMGGYPQAYQGYGAYPYGQYGAPAAGPYPYAGAPGAAPYGGYPGATASADSSSSAPAAGAAPSSSAGSAPTNFTCPDGLNPSLYTYYRDYYVSLGYSVEAAHNAAVTYMRSPEGISATSGAANASK